jgi:alkylated DNA repair dioxygenase AlkB
MPAIPDDIRAEAQIWVWKLECSQSLSTVLIMPESNPIPEPPADVADLASKVKELPDTGAGALAAIMDRYRRGLL